MKATAILVVEHVEATRDFFCAQLGFEIATEVPHGDAVGFAILTHASAEIMIQSRASLDADMATIAGLPLRALLYLDVADARALHARLSGAEVVVALRTTFYGADEFFVREPGGNIIGFSSTAAG